MKIPDKKTGGRVERPPASSSIHRYRSVALAAFLFLAMLFLLLADFRLNLAGRLFELAFQFAGRIAGHFCSAFLDAALDLFTHTFGLISVHGHLRLRTLMKRLRDDFVRLR